MSPEVEVTESNNCNLEDGKRHKKKRAKKI